MSEKKSSEQHNSWVTQVGESEGVRDKRVELIEDRAMYVEMLEIIDEDLSSAFPTIASVALRPEVVRAIEIVDQLTSTPLGDTETWNTLTAELGALDMDMMRGMRAQFIQERDVKEGAIWNDNPVASEDHVTIIPEGWDTSPKH